MGLATGYTCDYADCHKFQAVKGDKEKPAGWITMQVHVNNTIGEDVEPAHLILCSNKCLLNVAKERYATEKPTRQQRERRNHSDEFKSQVVMYANEHGASEAAEKYDLSRSLVQRWLVKVGLAA